jgi:hypothetical protein
MCIVCVFFGKHKTHSSITVKSIFLSFRSPPGSLPYAPVPITRCLLPGYGLFNRIAPCPNSQTRLNTLQPLLIWSSPR